MSGNDRSPEFSVFLCLILFKWVSTPFWIPQPKTPCFVAISAIWRFFLWDRRLTRLTELTRNSHVSGGFPILCNSFWGHRDEWEVQYIAVWCRGGFVGNHLCQGGIVGAHLCWEGLVGLGRAPDGLVDHVLLGDLVSNSSLMLRSHSSFIYSSLVKSRLTQDHVTSPHLPSCN